MIRMLHTADWHLGHSLHQVSRQAEHAAFLQWLQGLLTAREIDVLLIAGDIFDVSNPPIEAQRQWHAFLGQAWRDNPHLQVIAIAGNHDSASRLDASAPLLQGLQRLHVVGAPDDEAVLAVQGRDGERAWVLAAPFLRPFDLPHGVSPAEGVAAVYARLLQRAQQVRQPHEALLATGHCYLVGGEVSELSERRLHVGHQAALPASIFDPALAYVALGHLHKAQSVAGEARLRYAGSPLPLALAERSYRHEVSIVTLQSGQLRQIEAVAVPRTVELVRWPAEGALELPMVLTQIADLPLADQVPTAAWPLLEIEVLLTAPAPQLRGQITAALRNRAVRLVRLGVTRAGSGGVLLADGEDAYGLDQLGPADVFSRRWQQAYGGAPDNAHLEVLDALLAAAGDPPAAHERRMAERDQIDAWVAAQLARASAAGAP